jgi:hypothetical protein
MPVLAQARRTDNKSLVQNWLYTNLAGITLIGIPKNQQVQNAVMNLRLMYNTVLPPSDYDHLGAIFLCFTPRKHNNQ